MVIFLILTNHLLKQLSSCNNTLHIEAVYHLDERYERLRFARQWTRPQVGTLRQLLARPTLRSSRLGTRTTQPLETSRRTLHPKKNGLEWRGRDRLPEHWTIQVNGVTMNLSTTDFGHLGIFPRLVQFGNGCANAAQQKIKSAQPQSSSLTSSPTPVELH